jgi:hypothetical protein
MFQTCQNDRIGFCIGFEWREFARTETAGQAAQPCGQPVIRFQKAKKDLDGKGSQAAPVE